MEGMQHMSELVFMVLCRKLGTSEQVTMRRDISDFREMMILFSESSKDFRIILSGSYKEGFRLDESDRDAMISLDQYRVIWNLSQNQDYNRYTLFLSDCSESPPGYTLLQLLLPAKLTVKIWASCFRMYEKYYLSSFKFRENMHFPSRPDSHVHGPCRSGNFKGIEFDDAYCFASDFWPPSTLAWIDRCHSWPSPHVVDDIVRNGCHFVAIGHKQGNHEENEWRISFSYAERKLVYCMNHCQFLTYGLLKLILKEIIRENIEESLLSSYHLKTAVFWVIQQNLIPDWYPQNLLECFWVCFKRLLKWVYEGVCPNFFIPENNMFLNKIFGKSQRELFLELHGLYEKGIALLQQSHSVRSFTIDFFCNPRQCMSFNQQSEDWEVVFDSDLFREISNNDAIFTQNLNRCLHLLRSMETLINLYLKNYTNYQILMAQKLTVTILQSTAFVLHSRCANIVMNKLMYKADKISCYMLKLAAKMGFVSDILYLVMYYYKTFRHIKARKILEIANNEFQQPYLMYMSDVDINIYTAEVGGQSCSTKMRRAVVGDIRLSTNIHYIDELIHEQRLTGHIEGTIHISPFVMLLMLEFLCYRKFDEYIAAVAIYDLKNLVEEGDLIRPCTRDICWQILGICQQLQGDLWAALYSYREAARQDLFHNLKKATVLRIRSLDK
ncbi:uncharacterized protein LOC133178292 [Saccostrea echinata]|uniref:uncharacterized protein LOC133178292 n=1 Tax=Saccostrea echinata TaxID=191078 RepID=UPI002A80698F|nr:uncharacterized protein LOC133178292 [Saccostrea echinata]